MKNEFLEKIVFTDETSHAECEKYIQMKGLVLYKRIFDYLVGESDRLEYAKISDLIRYDKRLRNTLYRYLSMFEERIRAYVCNKYNDKLPNNIIINDRDRKIFKKIKGYNSLMMAFEELDFGNLLVIIKALPDEDKKELFAISAEMTEQNLDAIRVLRNKVCHNVFLLLLYNGFESCLVNGLCNNTLLHNLENFSRCMITDYKLRFIRDINNCSKDLSVEMKLQIKI